MNQTDRILNERGPLKEKEIQNFVFEEDTENINNFLILNGGPGIGKTKETITTTKEALTKKHGKSPKMLFVESRTATVEQISIQYNEYIETFGGIEVKQRIAFMNMIKNGEVDNYDWVVIDECHGLFSEASFAEDASYIANWIRCGRTKQHIIFITANDEYFTDIFKNYFPAEYSYSQLFKDPLKYNSSIYVKTVNCIITKNTIQRIHMLLPRLKNKKGIMFFSRASAVKNWFFELVQQHFNCFPMVSTGNQTAAQLSIIQEQILRDMDIDESGGESGITMADFEHSVEASRILHGQEPVRATLMKEARLPDDIDVLLSTDTLQEGISIVSPINYILIEGYTEVEVRQKLGRYRGVLDELYLVINPTAVVRKINQEKERFELLLKLEEENDQIGLAQWYTFFTMKKWKKRYVIQDEDGHFQVNKEAYQHFLRTSSKLKSYSPTAQLKDINTEAYARDLLKMYVKNPQTDIIMLEEKDLHNFNLKSKIQIIVDKWAGIPLKGLAQEEFIEDFAENDITDVKGKNLKSFQACLNVLRSVGFTIENKQATVADLKKYPEFLKKRKEKYYIILSP